MQIKGFVLHLAGKTSGDRRSRRDPKPPYWSTLIFLHLAGGISDKKKLPSSHFAQLCNMVICHQIMNMKKLVIDSFIAPSFWSGYLVRQRDRWHEQVEATGRDSRPRARVMRFFFCKLYNYLLMPMLIVQFLFYFFVKHHMKYFQCYLFSP